MPLLEVKHLKLYYPVNRGWFHRKAFVRAVDDVSFTLESGETLGLVGESGCGKSSLGRTLVRLEKPTAGEIILNGKNILELKGSALRRERKNFQMIFQDPYGSLNPRLTVLQALDEVLRLIEKTTNVSFEIVDRTVHVKRTEDAGTISRP